MAEKAPEEVRNHLCGLQISDGLHVRRSRMPRELGSDAVRDACLVCAMTVHLANT